MIRICLYLKEDKNNPSKQQVLEVNRVPAMGEFIDLGFNLYRVFWFVIAPITPTFKLLLLR